MPVRDVHLAKTEDEAFGGTAGFEEFGQVDLDNLESSRLKVGAEFVADVVEEDVASDVDGVAGELQGIGFGDADAVLVAVARLDFQLGFAVEGGREIHDVAIRERAEAGVEVIEAGIDEAEGDDLDVPEIGELAMAVLQCARAMAGPKAGAVRLKERVAFAFKGRETGNVANGEAGIGEPAAEVGFFSLTFAMMEAAQRDDAVADQTGVGGEDHVWGSGLGLDEADLSNLAEGAVELVPLLSSSQA